MESAVLGLILDSSVIIDAERKGQTVKRHVPVHPVTDETGEIMGRISGEQAAKGITIPFEDLAIGAAPHFQAVETV